jgi:hypothetical protein
MHVVYYIVATHEEAAILESAISSSAAAEAAASSAFVPAVYFTMVVQDAGQELLLGEALREIMAYSPTTQVIDLRQGHAQPLGYDSPSPGREEPAEEYAAREAAVLLAADQP